MRRKMRLLGILAVFMLLIFADVGIASVVDISVTTDKPIYLLGEYVTVSITAYNPNQSSVTLTGGFYFTSYLMDGTYDWAEGRYAPQIIEHVTINPGESCTWVMTHGFWEIKDYPLVLGTHTVIGKVLATELAENNQSSPIEFEVIPEPTSIVLFGFALSILRVFTKRRK